MKPWTDPLADEELQDAKQIVYRILEEQNNCGKTISADLSLMIITPFKRSTVSGFFQFTKPTNYKFIVSNPFGQPLLITVGNQKFFRSVNTMSRAYKTGSIRSFGVRNSIPSHFLKGSWYEWLTGSKALNINSIFEIRNSSDLKGIWVTFKNEDKMEIDHILIDRDQQKVMRRILEGTDGEKRANIRYEVWTMVGNCSQPTEILVKGFDLSTEISFKLSDISISDEQVSEKIPIPYGYSKTYLP